MLATKKAGRSPCILGGESILILLVLSTRQRSKRFKLAKGIWRQANLIHMGALNNMAPKEWLKFYQDVLEHLKKTNQAFCFLADGQIIAREDCENFIKLYQLRGNICKK